MIKPLKNSLIATAIVAAPTVLAASVTGTPNDDFLFFQGSDQAVNTTLTNPYSGLSVVVSGTFSVNTETYDGLGGTDIMIGTANPDYLVIEPSPGVQTVTSVEVFIAGNRDDVINLASTAFSLGSVTISGGAGNDIVWGNVAGDIINASSGDDLLDGGLGDDVLRGQKGDDTFHFGLGYGTDRIEGGEDFDTVVFAAGITLADLIITPTGPDPSLLTYDISVGSFGDKIEASQLEKLRFSDGSGYDLISMRSISAVPTPAAAAAGLPALLLLGVRRRR